MIVIFLLTLLYSFSLTNTIFGGDAGDLLSAILTTGFPHPPGYPFYTVLGIIFNAFPFAETTAGRVTVLSLASTVAALVVLAGIIKEISYKEKINKIFLAVTLLTIGLNYVVWLYAVVPEVFPLNTLITLLIFYSAIRYDRTKKINYLYTLAFLVGLGISHHHTFVIGFIAALYILYPKAKSLRRIGKNLIKTCFFFLLGLIPIFYLVISYKLKSQIIWEQTDSLQGLLKVLLRVKYGSFLAAPLVLEVPQNRFSQISKLFLFMEGDFTRLGIFFIFLGIYYLLSRKIFDKRISYALLFAAFLYGPFFLYYANFPLINPYFIATVERYLHIYYFLLGIFLYFGLVFLVDHLYKNALKKILKNANAVSLSAFLFSLILFIYPLTLYMKSSNQILALRNDKTAENLGVDILNATDARSLIVLSSDLTLFNSLYVYHSQPHIQKERVILHPNKLGEHYYKDMLNKHYPEIIIKKPLAEDYQISDFFMDNRDRFSIYTEELVKLPSSMKEYEWVPYGFIYKLEKRDEKGERTASKIENYWQTSHNEEILKDFGRDNFKYKNLFTAEILRVYRSAHQVTAQFLLYRNQNKEALTHIKHIVYLNKDEQDAGVTASGNYFLSIYYYNTGDCRASENYLLKAYSYRKNGEYLAFLKDIAESCYKDEENKKRINLLLKKIIESQFKSIDEL